VEEAKRLVVKSVGAGRGERLAVQRGVVCAVFQPASLNGVTVATKPSREVRQEARRLRAEGYSMSLQLRNCAYLIGKSIRFAGTGLRVIKF